MTLGLHSSPQSTVSFSVSFIVVNHGSRLDHQNRQTPRTTTTMVLNNCNRRIVDHWSMINDRALSHAVITTNNLVNKRRSVKFEERHEKIWRFEVIKAISLKCMPFFRWIERFSGPSRIIKSQWPILVHERWYYGHRRHQQSENKMTKTLGICCQTLLNLIN